LIDRYSKQDIVINSKEIFTVSKNSTYELSIKNLLSYKNIPENQIWIGNPAKELTNI
jgi:hypothetical protein